MKVTQFMHVEDHTLIVLIIILANKEFIFSRPEKAFCSITFDEMVNINRKSLCGNRTVTHVFFTLLLAKNVHCSTKRQVFFRYLD